MSCLGILPRLCLARCSLYLYKWHTAAAANEDQKSWENVKKKLLGVDTKHKSHTGTVPCPRSSKQSDQTRKDSSSKAGRLVERVSLQNGNQPGENSTNDHCPGRAGEGGRLG